MNLTRFVIFFSLVAVLGFGGGVRAQEPVRTGNIEGTVRVKDAPNAAVEVTAIDADSGQPYFTKTDDKGRFRFSGLPPGEFQVFAAVGRFYPVWETGTVDVETPWRPELHLEARAIRETPSSRLTFASLTALEQFRRAATIDLGTVETVESVSESSENNSSQWFRVTVLVRKNIKDKWLNQSIHQIPVGAGLGNQWGRTLYRGQRVLFFYRSSVLVSEPFSRLFFPPEVEAQGFFSSERVWQLFEMTESNRISRSELTEWLVGGIQNGKTRMEATIEALEILRRSQELENASVQRNGPDDPFDLADPEHPLFSEAQMKRIADSIFQDDAITETDLEVVRLLIELKYAGVEKILLTRIEKRKTDWTGQTGNMLRLHSSLKTEKELGRLANLFESVQFAARMQVYPENPNQTQMSVEEQLSRMRVLAEPQLLAILKSYLWTVEHPVKDAK